VMIQADVLISIRCKKSLSKMPKSINRQERKGIPQSTQRI
jgi:hypothetical protein